MTIPSGGHLGEKFIGFFRLVDACDQPGCPVCRCLTADATQYLEALIYEQVNDPDTRRRLHASRGFCNWHAWMLRQTSNPAFGAAIIYEDLLRMVIRRFERRAARPPREAGRLSRWLRRLSGRPERPGLDKSYGRRASCPACQAAAAAEERYLVTTLRFFDDPQFDRAYRRSAGLCVPHVLRALEVGGDTAESRLLVARTLPKWAELRRDLADFVSKHDYQNRVPFTEAEATAYLRAFEALAGAAGVFGNEVHEVARPAPRRSGRGADGTGATPGHEQDPAFERAKLELRVEELTNQLNEASSRAAALHYRLAQVAEDRNVLEVNVSGERAANELSQQVIGQLRMEVERLQAQLATARSARVQ